MTDDAANSIAALKQSIREQAHARRRAQPDKDSLSQSICACFTALPEYVRAGAVLFYLDVR